MCAQQFETAYIENKGNGNFEIKELPIEAQFAPVFGMLAEDFNSDGFIDVLLAGNSYATEVSTGQYDASIGLYLQNDGRGNFKPVNAHESGFYDQSDAKGMAKLKAVDGSALVLIGNNSGAIKSYTVHQNGIDIAIQKDDAYALITKRNGVTYKHEFYYGSTYLSQSSRQLLVSGDVVLIEIFTRKGNGRKISINAK